MTLEGDSARRHLHGLRTALAAARLDRGWPDPRALRSHLRAIELGLPVHGGVEITPASGLPTWPVWQRTATDREIAPKALAQMPAEEALARDAGRGPDDAARLERWRYYDALMGLTTAPLGTVGVRLRRRVPHEVDVVLDKLDAAGFFVRCTAHLRLGHRQTLVDGEAPSPGLHGLLFRSGAVDVELVSATLAAQTEVEVLQVTLGVVGPVRTSEMPADQLLAEGSVCARFGLDSAAGGKRCRREKWTGTADVVAAGRALDPRQLWYEISA